MAGGIRTFAFDASARFSLALSNASDEPLGAVVPGRQQAGASIRVQHAVCRVCGADMRRFKPGGDVSIATLSWLATKPIAILTGTSWLFARNSYKISCGSDWGWVFLIALFIGGLGYIGGGSDSCKLRALQPSTIVGKMYLIAKSSTGGCGVGNRDVVQCEDERNGTGARSSASSGILARGECPTVSHKM